MAVKASKQNFDLYITPRMKNINENVKDPSHPWFWLILRLFYLWQFSLDSNLVLIADDEFKPRISVQEKTEMRIPMQFMKWF